MVTTQWLKQPICFCCGIRAAERFVAAQGKCKKCGPTKWIFVWGACTPPGNLEILHALKCVLGAPEALFRSCTQYIYTCKLPSSISSWERLSSPRGSVTARLGVRDFEIHALDFTWISDIRMDFWISKWISKWISGFQSGFLDFKVDFWISSGFLDFKADFWISFELLLFWRYS